MQLGNSVSIKEQLITPMLGITVKVCHSSIFLILTLDCIWNLLYNKSNKDIIFQITYKPNTIISSMLMCFWVLWTTNDSNKIWCSSDILGGLDIFLFIQKTCFRHCLFLLHLYPSLVYIFCLCPMIVEKKTKAWVWEFLIFFLSQNWAWEQFTLGSFLLPRLLYHI